MEVVIVVRNTEDWDSLNLDAYLARGVPGMFGLAQKKDGLAMLTNNLRAWETRRLNFFQYRSLLKDAAMKTWKLPYIRDHEVSGESRDVIYIPLDDDDSVRPDLLGFLTDAFADSRVDVVTWNMWDYQIFGRKERFLIKPDDKTHWIPSNAYALRASVATKKRIKCHTEIWDSGLNIRHLDEILAIRVHHPACMSRLLRREVVFHEPKRAPKPLGIEWASGLIDEVYELTRRACLERRSQWRQFL